MTTSNRKGFEMRLDKQNEALNKIKKTPLSEIILSRFNNNDNTRLVYNISNNSY